MWLSIQKITDHQIKIPFNVRKNDISVSYFFAPNMSILNHKILFCTIFRYLEFGLIIMYTHNKLNHNMSEICIPGPLNLHWVTIWLHWIMQSDTQLTLNLHRVRLGFDWSYSEWDYGYTEFMQSETLLILKLRRGSLWLHWNYLE
jgi:hypothetical protein